MRSKLSVLVVVLGVAGLAGALTTLARGTRLPTHPLELAPDGTSVVGRIDVPALLRSPLWEAWVGEGDAGYQRVVAACGFDPLTELSSVDVYVVGTERRPLDQLGFVARGVTRHEELVRCIGEITEADGGGVHEVEIEGVRAIASDHGDSRAAFVGRDGLLGGNEDLVRDVIRRLHGEGPSLVGDESFSELWRRVEARGQLVVVMRLPESWRAALPRMLGLGAPFEPFMSALALGVGARIDRGLGARAVLELGSSDDARDAEAAIVAAVDEALARPLVRLSHVGSALSALDTDTDGARLVVTAELDDDELAAVVALARESLSASLDEEPNVRSGALDEITEEIQPDEVVTPGEPAGPAGDETQETTE